MYHLHFKLNKFPNTDGRNLENEEGKGSNLKIGRSEETSACLLCLQIIIRAPLVSADAARWHNGKNLS